MIDSGMSSTRIAIMQGRLVPPEAERFQSFPRESWRLEFERAANAGLDAIEWIYDAFGDDINPIATNDGIAEMKALCAQHGIAVVSLCADYFMDRPLVRAAGPELRDIVSRLYWLIERCRRMGIQRIVMPFVDDSKLENRAGEERAIAVLRDVLPVAVEAQVELHLETSLNPRDFAALLDRLDHPSLKCNYDSGNSASLGYDPVEEFAAYGARIGSVHVKDRRFQGGTVPLGTGDAKLDVVFAELARRGYTGDYVLQVARGEPGDEIAWCRRNLEYAAGCIERAKQSIQGAIA